MRQKRNEDTALCRAAGRACAVVHTAGHAIGYPMYGFSAIVLFYRNTHADDHEGEWARFLLK